MVNGGRALQILFRRHEHLQDKVLHVVDTPRVPGELRVIILDVRRRILHLERQQVRFVQEQDDRDVLERRVVDDRVEDVARLLQPIRALVLGQHLVELGRRDEEQDRRHRTIEAFRPLLALRPLATDVDKDKRNVLDANRELKDALRGLATVQDVLIGRRVLGPRYPLQFVEEITNGVALKEKN